MWKRAKQNPADKHPRSGSECRAAVRALSANIPAVMKRENTLPECCECGKLRMKARWRVVNASYSIHELKSALSPVFSQYGVRSATLFGSYAKGSANLRSDVDILVDSGLKGLQFFGLLESVSSALRIPVDLIDVTQLEPGSAIEQEIRKTGVPLYGQ
jgi:hypothetical protein